MGSLVRSARIIGWLELEELNEDVEIFRRISDFICCEKALTICKKEINASNES